MSQPITVQDAAASIQTPAGVEKKIVGATNLLKRPAANSSAPPDASGVLSKLQSSILDGRQLLSSLATTHPHVQIFKSLIETIEMQTSAITMMLQQQQALIGRHNQFVDVFQQMRARQMPLEVWMQRVSEATVVMDVKVQFPAVEPSDIPPLIPPPGKVSEDGMEESSSSEVPPTQPLDQ